MLIMVTGCAGFIGMHTAKRLLDRGDQIIGVDNLNDYYEVSLKKARLAQLTEYPNFVFYPYDIADRKTIESLFEQNNIQRVIHLAAQAGVRYSLDNPHAYIDSNIQGYMNILEGCRHHQVEHLVYASSSSVYGNNKVVPFDESQNIDHPISLYAATKKANELMAHSYSHLYDLPTTGLRFFTVYGPWGRPDMAFFKFIRAMLSNEPISIYNNGNLTRDFTYIDDIVESMIRVLDKPAYPDAYFDDNTPNPASSGQAPYRIFNIGNQAPTHLMDCIAALENALGIIAKKNFFPMQQGDMLATYANTDLLNKWIDFSPSTPLSLGVERFVTWYLSYINK